MARFAHTFAFALPAEADVRAAPGLPSTACVELITRVPLVAVADGRAVYYATAFPMLLMAICSKRIYNFFYQARLFCSEMLDEAR
jgi:hypothetical protein